MSTITLLGGPIDGAEVDASEPGVRWMYAQLEVRPTGRRWVDHVYDPLTGRYLGEREL